MNPTAAALNRLAYTTDLAIDKIVAPLAESIPAAIRRHATEAPDGTPVLTALGYALVMREVSREIATIYGAHRGNRNAPIYRLIANAASVAHRMPVEATVGEMRRRLKGEPALLARLERKG